MSSIGNASTELDTLELGFVEKKAPWHLMSHLFPNKVGGRPAWLALDHLPKDIDLECTICHKQMAFLMQVYCPVDGRDDCFHRTIFLFMCRNGSCYTQHNDSRPLRAFRSQLPRENKYYSYEPPADDFPSQSKIEAEVAADRLPHASKYQPLCVVCGCPGSKKCGQCAKVNYCSKEHQQIHWKTAHKALCSKYQSDEACPVDPRLEFSASPALLPEFEISTGPDPTKEDEDRYEEKENMSVPLTEGDCAEADALEEVAKKETPRDKLFRKLKEAMAAEPQQIMRYHKNGRPLWLDPNEDPTVALCECGAPRQFELQITPQLLNHLKLDGDDPAHASPDWGSLYVYTCSSQCHTEEREYSREVVIRQDVQ